MILACILALSFGPVAQLGERTVRIREVRGFDPLRVHHTSIARTLLLFYGRFCRHLRALMPSKESGHFLTALLCSIVSIYLHASFLGCQICPDIVVLCDGRARPYPSDTLSGFRA